MIKTDVLIIGTGISGLSTAIYLSERDPNIDITIIAKRRFDENNTIYAQGGIATVWNSGDSFDHHIQDTLIAGDGLCHEATVKHVVEQGPSAINDLIHWGTEFDKIRNNDQQFDLGIEGGHSHPRILHYKDITGREIYESLIERLKTFSNISMFEHLFAVDLLTQHHLGRNITRLSANINCFGAYLMDTNSKSITRCLSKFTVLATGGTGECYKATTNPTTATGDGIAMTYRAKGRIANMEFIQFHPTSLYRTDQKGSSFLISEAVRGLGATLMDHLGHPFMKKYDPRGSLAPRDIVARAIDQEMNRSGMEHVFLDCRHIDSQAFQDHFPNIMEHCRSIGIDPIKDPIPVVPAAHYCCGGILVNTKGQSSIQGLYAVGECSFTGLHGANRLASNSLLEAMVYGKHCAQDIIKEISGRNWKEDIPDWDAKSTSDAKEKILLTQSLKELKEIMSFYVRIVRSDVRLKRAMDRLNLLYQETESLYRTTILSPQLCELRNMITIGYLITRSAILRKESRGLHYTTDYPEKNHQFIENTYL